MVYSFGSLVKPWYFMLEFASNMFVLGFSLHDGWPEKATVGVMPDDAEDMAGADGGHERGQAEGGVHDDRRDGVNGVDQSDQSNEMVNDAEDKVWVVHDGLQDDRRDGESEVDQSDQSNGVVDDADDGGLDRSMSAGKVSEDGGVRDGAEAESLEEDEVEKGGKMLIEGYRRYRKIRR